MAAVSATDIKHPLRKLDFPFSAREALDRAEQLCISADSDAEKFPKNLELIQGLIAEFVFCEIDKRGNKKRPLKATAELNLLEILCDHFSKASPSNICAARNSLFLWLFHPAAEGRIRVLSKLVSLAISTKRIAVLATAGLWMQCTLPTSLQSTVNLANMLVKDFFILTPLAASKLTELPQLAPLFTANLLTAFTAMFGVQPGFQNPPPVTLLEMVSKWLSENPHLCFTPLLQPSPGAVPGGDPITPVVGLFRWCILSPLHGPNSPAEESTAILEVENLFSSLHLSLMQGLLMPLPGQHACAVRADDLAALTDELALFLKTSSASISDESRQLTLDRLGQAVETSLAADHVSGNINSLLIKLAHLPPTKLLKIILTNRTSV